MLLKDGDSIDDQKTDLSNFRVNSRDTTVSLTNQKDAADKANLIADSIKFLRRDCKENFDYNPKSAQAIHKNLVKLSDTINSKTSTKKKFINFIKRANGLDKCVHLAQKACPLKKKKMKKAQVARRTIT